MNVGDLVRRKNTAVWRANTSTRRNIGIILSVQMGGINPSHPCVTVFYHDGKSYDIAQSLVEVINA